MRLKPLIDVVGTCIYFRFEVIHFEQPIWRSRMSFREAGHSDPETAAIWMRAGLVEPANEFNQIDCMLKRIARFIIRNSNRPITAERENISNGRIGVSKENRFDLLFVMTDAGKVGDRVEL